jgi:outer membrane protein assembly factor BamA
MSPDQSLLIRNDIKIKNPTDEITKTVVDSRIVQDPNTTFLGMRWKLSCYNAAKDSNNNWWNRNLRELGEPPVVFDSSTIDESLNRINRFLNDKGYFEPTVSATVKRMRYNKRKIEVSYLLILNKPYRINKTSLTVNDDSVSPYLKNFDKETLLKHGTIYDVDLFDSERDRIATQLQAEGFLYFGRNSVSFLVDSSLGNHSMNVNVIVSPDETKDSAGNTTSISHQKYYLRNISFLSENRRFSRSNEYDTLFYDNRTKKEKKKGKPTEPYTFIYQGKQAINPAILVQKTFLSSGEKYSSDNVRKSYENLSDLHILGYSNITFTKARNDDAESDDTTNSENVKQADCQIILTQGSRYGLTADVEYTTSAGLQGPAVNLSFLDRNIFHGGEVFSFRLSTKYEFQVSNQSNSTRNVTNVFEIALNASIDFPRFLIPFGTDHAFKSFRPKSTVSVGYGFQMKQYYTRGIFNTAWGYSWRNNKMSHIFNPTEINTVKMFRKSEEFETFLAGNTSRLRYQYEDHFVLNMNYTFVYNEQTQNNLHDFNYFRIRAETAGALLYLLSKAVHGKMNNDGQYVMLGLSFSQYIKAEAEYKHHFVFSKNSSLVFRTLIGAGYAYGNSKIMPYEKSFFAGGSSTLRAWTLYHVGPGSWSDPEYKNMERLGDMTILLNLEGRFPIYSFLKGAVFVDAGNIWTLSKDTPYRGGNFSKGFYKELAVNTGVGLRLDFNYFLIRVDLGIPMLDPWKQPKDRWVWKKGGMALNDLVINFGIGYPF